MIEVGDKVYNYTFPEECNMGIVISKESETEFTVEYRNRATGELYKIATLDYDIHKNNCECCMFADISPMSSLE